MKLANTTYYIACKNDLNRAGRNCPRPTRFTTSRTFNIRRPLTRVVARWHVCPKTHRLECLWLLEPMVCDDQLCRSRTQDDAMPGHACARQRVCFGPPSTLGNFMRPFFRRKLRPERFQRRRVGTPECSNMPSHMLGV